MSLVDRARSEYATWIASVAEAVVTARGRISRQQVVRLVETAANVFTMHMTAAPKQVALADVQFSLGEDGQDPPLPEPWTSVLRGARVEVELRAARFLERPLELPRRASEFMDAMIRSQIDRLTPWTASEAAFSWTSPVDVGNDRIKVNVIAVPKVKLNPLIQLIEDWGVGSVALNVSLDPASPDGPRSIKLLERRFSATLDVARVRGALNVALLSVVGAAALAFVVGDFLGARLDAEQQQLAARIAERRSAVRLGAGAGGDAAQNLLVRRKQATPSAVMALEALSKILPDDTYVTELRIEKDKLQIVGITQDAPALVNLIEQSPLFSRATFFAPTTRAANDPGERFHVEVRLQPSFGSKT
ncbi:MAG: PilN domain-containing protein [Xanthobacteraceae bacterium]|nr:PilN domain-containing protein [Xanthobacteraceae bacterium]